MLMVSLSNILRLFFYIDLFDMYLVVRTHINIVL